MDYEIIEKILTESNKYDWLNLFNNGKAEFVYKEDFNLVIRKDIEAEEEPVDYYNNIFKDDIEQYPCWYNVYYDDVLEKRVKMLEVDNRSIIIPYLMDNHNKVREIDTNIARIINQNDETDKSIKAAGLWIVDPNGEILNFIKRRK
ncbi:MAG: hypothetical protein ACPKOI_03440 [Pleomorphochaeta sp.]